MLVENSLDELRVGVKGQSNSVIARSPRNSFRASLGCFVPEVEHWMDEGPSKATESYQTPNAGNISPGVRLWGLSFIVERETAQTAS